MRIITAVVILICIPILGFAQDCVLIPDKSFCGVTITATSEHFIKALGEPDGQIKMGTDRIGYFYGPKLLIIFCTTNFGKSIHGKQILTSIFGTMLITEKQEPLCG